MKTLKVLLAAFMMIAMCDVFAQPASGQRHGGMKPMSDSLRKARYEMHMAKMKASLNLTDAQVKKIEVLDKETMTKMKKQDADRKAIIANKDKQMSVILNADQYKKWQEWKAQMQQSRKGHGDKGKACCKDKPCQAGKSCPSANSPKCCDKK